MKKLLPPGLPRSSSSSWDSSRPRRSSAPGAGARRRHVAACRASLTPTRWPSTGPYHRRVLGMHGTFYLDRGAERVLRRGGGQGAEELREKRGKRIFFSRERKKPDYLCPSRPFVVVVCLSFLLSARARFFASFRSSFLDWSPIPVILEKEKERERERRRRRY